MPKRVAKSSTGDGDVFVQGLLWQPSAASHIGLGFYACDHVDACFLEKNSKLLSNGNGFFQGLVWYSFPDIPIGLGPHACDHVDVAHFLEKNSKLQWNGDCIFRA